MLASLHPDPFCEFIIARLTAAGWVEGSRFHTGSGYQLLWTTGGGQRILLLKEIAEIHGITATSGKAFTMACKTGDEGIPEPVARFWLECVRELELGLEPSTLAIFVTVIKSPETVLEDAS